MASHSNKKIGSAFERTLCQKLANLGYWVHFLAPDARGAQPFDIIAVKHGVAYAIDCKTCVAATFNISRLEENQFLSFEHWLRCGNTTPIIAVLHGGEIYAIEYDRLKEQRSIKLNTETERPQFFWDDERSDT